MTPAESITATTAIAAASLRPCCDQAARPAMAPRVTAWDFDRQVAEFQLHVAVLIGFTALGTPITEVAG